MRRVLALCVALSVSAVACDRSPTDSPPTIEGSYVAASVTTASGAWWPLRTSSLTLANGEFAWTMTGTVFESDASITIKDHGTYTVAPGGASAELVSATYGWQTTVTLADTLLTHRIEPWGHTHLWRRAD